MSGTSPATTITTVLSELSEASVALNFSKARRTACPVPPRRS